MSNRPVKGLVKDILEAIEKIDRFTYGYTMLDFLSDEKTSDAVVRNLKIIGEAANRLPKEFHDRYPEIELPKIIGLRSRIAHKYFGIDLMLIWNITQNELSVLAYKLERIQIEFDLHKE